MRKHSIQTADVLSLCVTVNGIIFTQPLIGHFRVAVKLIVKARLSAKLFIIKLIFFACVFQRNSYIAFYLVRKS